jgi:hypothetical protein
VPREDNSNGEGPGEVFFTEISGSHGEEEEDVLSSLSNHMGRLNI